MMILGIDPGTLKMGYGVLESTNGKMRLEDYGTIKLSSKMDIHHRLYQMHSHVLNMISIFNPYSICVEEPFLGTGSKQFVKSTLAIGQAQAAVLIAAAAQEVPIYRYAPTQVKSAVVGHGQADKQAVQDVIFNLFKINDAPSDDATDAVAIAVCHALSYSASEIISSKIIQ
tara:strand:- start:25004 stop:25516 length:513 start_codon:yes stop_codon:yes gene_type:complete